MSSGAAFGTSAGRVARVNGTANMVGNGLTPERVARRSDWVEVSDAQLLAQCDVDTYRASGPGGQKRNKTSSAVRLRHRPSGLIVIAEESRSQHENRRTAVRRLRQAIYLNVREDPSDGPLAISEPGAARPRGAEVGFRPGRKDARFWPAVGSVLDLLVARGARVRETALALGISTGNLIDFLRTDAKVWQQANRIRGRFGQKPLRS